MTGESKETAQGLCQGSFSYRVPKSGRYQDPGQEADVQHVVPISDGSSRCAAHHHDVAPHAPGQDRQQPELGAQTLQQLHESISMSAIAPCDMQHKRAEWR